VNEINHLKEAKRKKMKTEEETVYYVTMSDMFMSGWGDAKGKINKLVFVCKSYEEAKIVEDNAHNRTDMNHINICTTKPYYNKDRYYTQIKDEGDYDAWYVPNYFRNRNRI
jgi:hypothetical protein